MYTDHHPVEVMLGGIPRRKKLVMKTSAWNMGKPDGWKVYQELSEKAADSIENIVDNE